jgi:hypothetical protein
LTVTEPDAPSLAQAMRALLDDDAWHARLCAEAAQRRFPTWNDYARGLLAWLETLPKRAGG